MGFTRYDHKSLPYLIQRTDFSFSIAAYHIEEVQYSVILSNLILMFTSTPNRIINLPTFS